MISRAGRSVTRLRVQCIGSLRSTTTLSAIERTLALDNLRSSNCDAFRLQCRSLSLSRSYADKPVSRPKAHTGRTSTTQKRAPTTAATKAAKEPAPKINTPKRIPKPESQAKRSPKPKRKAKAKAKPKPKKKVLTDKQQTARTVRERREKIKGLKQTALLKAPRQTNTTAWSVFLGEHLKGQGYGKDRPENHRRFGSISTEASAQFKAITPEQLEHYNHLANQATAARGATYLEWLQTHSPRQIREANVARRALIRLHPKKRPSNFPQLRDERLVQSPRNPFNYFIKSRFESGDFKGLRGPEAFTLATREWKGLSDAEKKPFKDTAAQDMQRYQQESKALYSEQK